MKKLFIFLTAFLITTVIVFDKGLQAQVTQEWQARYNNPGNTDDIPVGIAVDKAGNCYVTGNSIFTGYDVTATLKYNSQGVQQWVRIYRDTTLPNNSSTHIAIDSLSNVIFTPKSGHEVKCD